jgi:hypothetical protein
VVLTPIGQAMKVLDAKLAAMAKEDDASWGDDEALVGVGAAHQPAGGQGPVPVKVEVQVVDDQ